MKIEVALAGSRFGAGETIAATVSISNDSTATIEVPRPHSNQNRWPVYTITGPAYPRGRTFSFGSAVWGDGAPTDTRADTVRLGPGETKQEVVPLDQLVRLVEPGTYTLAADLVWAGAEAHSSPVSFTIERSETLSCQLAVGPGLAASPMVQAFCLRAAGSGARQVQIATFRFDRQRGTLARMSLGLHSLPSDGAETITAPWVGRGYSPENPSPRPVCQAGSTLAILGFRATGGAGITLPFSPQVVRPALAAASGEQDVFVVDNQGRRLTLVRFAKEDDLDAEGDSPPQSNPAKGAPKSARRPRLLWTMSLPAPISAGRAALAAPPGDESRHAVLVADDPAGTRVLLADAGDGSKISGVSTVNIPGWHVGASCGPGLHVDAQGRARTAVILQSAPRPDGSLDLALAEVTWELRRTGPHLDITDLLKLPAAPRAVAATYSASPAGAQRAWAVLTADGQVMSSNPGPACRPRGTPALPLDLALTDRFLALLTLDPFGAPEIERL